MRQWNVLQVITVSWKVVSEQVEFLRAGELEKAKNVMPKVSEMYGKMVENIKKIYP